MAQRVVRVVLERDRRARRPLGVLLAEALARARRQPDLLLVAQLRQQDAAVLAALARRTCAQANIFIRAYAAHKTAAAAALIEHASVQRVMYSQGLLRNEISTTEENIPVRKLSRTECN